MNTKKHTTKHLHTLRLWLLIAWLIGTHGFMWGQNVTITYDNPNQKPGVPSTGTGNSPSNSEYDFNAAVPGSAVNVIGKAYGGGGGGGARTSLGISHAGGGGGGGYIEKNWGTVSGFFTGKVGSGGVRGEQDALNGAAGAGTSSTISFGSITITASGGGAGFENDYGRGGGASIIGGTADHSFSGGAGGGSGSGAGGPGGDSGGHPNSNEDEIDYGGGKGGGYLTAGSGASQGYNANNPGGGGGGARSNLVNRNPGGHGGGGRVVLSYDIKPLTITTSETMCQNSAITLTASYGPGSGVTFQWYKDGVSLGTGATEQIYTINNAQALTHNGSYTVVATYNINYNNTTPAISSPASIAVTGSSLPTDLSVSGTTLLGTVTADPVTVSVNPMPELDDIESFSLCVGDEFSELIFTGNYIEPDSTTWEVTTGSWSDINMSAGSGTGSIPNFTATNAGNTALTVTIRVTPGSLAGCTGTAKSFTITVNPLPVLDNITSRSLCAGTAFSLIFTGTNVDANKTTWKVTPTSTNTGASIGMAESGTGSIQSFTTVNAGTTARTVTIEVTPISSAGCEGTPKTFTITVNPLPVLTNVFQNVTLCAGESFSRINFTGNNISNTKWEVISATTGASIGMPAESGNGTGFIPGFTASYVGSQQTVTIRVTPTSSTGCTVTPTTFTITVNPTPVIANKTATICSGGTFTLTPANTLPDVVPSGTTYSWSAPTPTGVTGAASGTNLVSISGTLTNTTDEVKTVTYVVTPKAGSCPGTPFNVVVTVNPKPNITAQPVAVCSGETVTPVLSGIIPAGTTYSWTVTSVTGTLTPTPSANAGANSSINLGAFTNNSTGNATIVYSVTPTSAVGCTGTPFTLTVTVYNAPQILPAGPSTICSGETLQLSPNSGGTYSSSDPAVAYVHPTSGLVSTDVDLINGVLTPRDQSHPNEGLGGTATITFTADAANGGCTATKVINVTPRTKTPQTRWDFAGICPVDEEEGVNLGDSTNIATPWNTGGDYFVNHIVWDSLVVARGEIDIPLEQITWYADETTTTVLRYGGTEPPAVGESGEMANFWQNEPHPSKTYWATVTAPGSCESKRIPVEVYIRETPEGINVTDLIGYVQPDGTPELGALDYLNLGLDESQTLEWYSSAEDAQAAYDDPDLVESLNKGTPENLDPTQPASRDHWLIKSDTYGCRSLPTHFKVRIFEMPKITITSNENLVCPGEEVELTVTIEDGTAPYNFKIVNMNSGETRVEQTDYENDTYTFTINPLSTVAYRITEFSDSITPLVTYPPYGLHVPENGFDETEVSVVVTEITGITPNSGPTAGGTYTTDTNIPTYPINPNGTVIIIGSGFAPLGSSTVSLVTFGGVPATNVTVINNDTLTCIPPPHVSGDVTVAVTTNCTTTTLTNGYRYEPINITEVGPDHAPVTGGTTIIIRGTGLLASPDVKDFVTVTLAGVAAEVVSVTNTEIVCKTDPSDKSLLGSIIINNGSETREFERSFTYYPVNFIENGYWNEPHKWETQTNDHILPFPKAKVHIHANCVQNIDVDMDSITVHASKAYTLNNGITLEANVFTLKENASFIDNNIGDTYMQAIQQNVEHSLTGGRNWYISNPVSDTNGLTATPTADRIEWYDETAKTWKTATTGLNTGQGYTIYSASANMNVKFSGKYNNSDQEYLALTRTTGEKVGYNLVGNPFPSYWRWTEEAALQANLYSTIWYRTVAGGVYEFWSYNASGNVAVMPGWEDATPTGSYSLGYIPPMQAFWVRVLNEGSSSTLTFADNRRSHADHGSNMLKSTSVNNEDARPLLRIAATNGVNTDETVIYFDARATEDFDTYDSDKWFVNQGVEIYTMPVSSTRELVINGLPEITNETEITLGFQASEGGAFSFRAKEMLNLDAFDVFLWDKWRNTKSDLRNDDYHFNSSSAPVTDRFSIVFHRSINGELAIDEVGDDNLFAYADKDGQLIVVLYLRNQQEGNANIAIFDITGRKITEQSVVVGERTILNEVFPEGVYVLRAEKCATKVMVKK